MRGSNSTRDRISDLPDNVLDKILCCLPVQEAGRTTVLSKTWRKKWETMSSLLFVSGGFQSPGKPKPTTAELKFKFFQVLLPHKGSLQRFCIRFPDMEPSREVDQIITRFLPVKRRTLSSKLNEINVVVLLF
ncbi:hypothetical protein Tsubulata_029523 [Turnera subulata]|uniref:F-box domain-containing protein n=1 Tax=Turnera subulata TaxID=218843 RepID=A0A9Q0F9T8_9ROSI|nr:hypothetical protein Tsubulata_029523 [Turnera subulata]